MCFLGFLIEYQQYTALELGSWASHVELDPVPNALRRFPHPTTIEPFIVYLLRRDAKWWEEATDSSEWFYRLMGKVGIDIHNFGRKWLRRFRLPTLLRYVVNSSPDEDPDHDPMMSRRTGLIIAIRCAVDVLLSDERDRLAQLTQTSLPSSTGGAMLQTLARSLWHIERIR